MGMGMGMHSLSKHFFPSWRDRRSARIVCIVVLSAYSTCMYMTPSRDLWHRSGYWHQRFR